MRRVLGDKNISTKVWLELPIFYVEVVRAKVWLELPIFYVEVVRAKAFNEYFKLVLRPTHFISTV
jgi:hypothetical protein